MWIRPVAALALVVAAPGFAQGQAAAPVAAPSSAPGPAQIVAQTFVDRLLKLDATQTQADAQGNVNLLEDQSANLQQQLTQIEGRMKQIAGANGAALSSATATMMTGGAGIDYAGQIASLQRENAHV